MVDLTGQVLGGRYRVDAFLGRGGMADVYKVWDMQRAVFLALKALHADLAEDKILLRRFEQEARTLEALQHPNIVRFYGLENTPAGVCILMDYIDGLTLRKEIFLAQGGLPTERILEVMQPVCAALYYAHQNGRVHCDIKPANIISHHNGAIYLADFGIARMAEGGTQTPIGAGTPAYMAPEQLTGRVPSPASDIYSLGVVLFEMVTGGQRPFNGDAARTQGSTTQRIVWEKHHLPAPSPRKYKPDLSPELEAVILRCLERKSNRRYATTLDLYRALEAAIQMTGPTEEDDLNTQVEIAHPSGKAQAAGSVLSAVASARSEEKKPSRGGRTALKAASRSAVEAAQPAAIEAAGPGRPNGKTAADRVSADALSASAPAGSFAAAELSDDQSEADYLPPLWRVYLNRRNMILAAAAALVVTLLALGLFAQPAHAPSLNPALSGSIAGLPQAQETGLAGAVVPQSAAPSQGTSRSPTLSSPTVGPTSTTGAAAAAATVQATSTTPSMQPTPLGGSSRIAFASDRSGSVQVWVMDTNNPDSREMITNMTGGACQPAWSPDGQAIAFTTPCKGPSIFYPGATIKVFNLKDRLITNLTLPGAGSFDPAWSPDGQTLAFTTIIGDKTIIQTISMKDKKTITTLASRGTKNAQPAYSPDGQYIAFITTDQVHSDALWLMRASGDSQEVLSNAGQFSEPTWTPDGGKLLVSLRMNSAIPVLALVERGNATPGGMPLLKGDYRMQHGQISPDGQWVLFWSDKENHNTEIFLVSANGKGDPRQLTNNGKLQDFQPSWEPRSSSRP